MNIDLHKTEDVLTAIEVACKKINLGHLGREEVLTETQKLLKLYTKQRLLAELRKEN